MLMTLPSKRFGPIEVKCDLYLSENYSECVFVGGNEQKLNLDSKDPDGLSNLVFSSAFRLVLLVALVLESPRSWQHSYACLSHKEKLSLMTS